MTQIPHNKDPKQILQGIGCFALDLDGTIYLGDDWIPGARGFLKRIKETGRRYAFITNNSSKSRRDYLKKLAAMGLLVDDSELVTSGEAAVSYVKTMFPRKRVFLMGTESLAGEFTEAGIILDNKSPELVVTAYDTSLTYEKLCMACNFINAGLAFIATHPDITCPSQTGYIPDIGSFHALIEAVTGRRPDVVIGKPGREIIGYMLKKTGAGAQRTAIVGDRLYTDVAAGINNSLTAVLVLSGEAALKDAYESDIKPHLIFDSVKDMIPYL